APASTSALRKLDLDVPSGVSASTHPDLAPQLRRTGGDRPWRGRSGGKPDAVVLDGDAYFLTDRIGRDHRRVSARVAPDVTGPLEHDLENMFDEEERAVKVRPNGEAGSLAQRGRRQGRLEIGQRADVRPELVVLPVHARLELRELDEGFLVLPASQKLATRRQPQVHASEGLHVPIVQRPCDAFSLRGCFQLADPRFEDHPLLSEVSDEVPGDGEIGGPHDVEVQALRTRYEDQAEVE